MHGDAAVEAGIDHLAHFIERLFEKHAADIQADLGILEPVELVHDRLHRLARARDRRHPVDRDLQLIEPCTFELREHLFSEEKAVGRHAHTVKPERFRITDQLDNVGMLERFASLETDAGDTEVPDVVHPFLEVGHGRVRDRVVVLVAVMAIEIALLGHIEMRNPRLAVENPKDLLETDHCCSYRPRREGVKQSRRGEKAPTGLICGAPAR